ncbi:hypothetical protein ACFV5N_15380 [Streptomyces sp. NPDC059853]|uniref:hypothetical protein n=1 Tax=Streptomyces sp. NPDC059853 TaxID=3346973 RepID=UPI00365FA228
MTPEDDSRAERELRALLSERADLITPSPPPVERITRDGRAARRRTRVALGTGLAALVALPGVLIAAQTGGATGDGGRNETAAPPAAPPAPETTDGAPEPGAGEDTALPLPPADPARQLLDGITYEQAAEALLSCVGPESEPDPAIDPARPALDAADFQILLAWEGEGDENRGPAPRRQVLAVTADPAASPALQLTCGFRPGEGTVSVQGAPRATVEPGQPPIVPDSSAGRHWYVEEWTPPFRWAHYGAVAPEVARVTVEYAGGTEEAVVDAGYFVAGGIAGQVPDAAPLLLGYDAAGELIYDSRTDDPRF